MFAPVARGPAEIGCRIPIAPFGNVALPMAGMRGCEVAAVMRGVMTVAVGAKGVMPGMGARGASPAVGTFIGVNMPKLFPGIMAILGTATKPKMQRHTYCFS